MRSIYPILGQAVPNTAQSTWAAGDRTLLSGLAPAVGTWDSTTNPLGFYAHVPQGERWLVNFALESYIQGPNVPTYQVSFGLVLKGATVLQPPHPNSPSPWSYHLGIPNQNDAAWGAFSVPVWLNPGTTGCWFAYGRDAGAINLQMRQIAGVPILGMKI